MPLLSHLHHHLLLLHLLHFFFSLFFFFVLLLCSWLALYFGSSQSEYFIVLWRFNSSLSSSIFAVDNCHKQLNARFFFHTRFFTRRATRTPYHSLSVFSLCDEHTRHKSESISSSRFDSLCFTFTIRWFSAKGQSVPGWGLSRHVLRSMLKVSLILYTLMLATSLECVTIDLLSLTSVWLTANLIVCFAMNCSGSASTSLRRSTDSIFQYNAQRSVCS